MRETKRDRNPLYGSKAMEEATFFSNDFSSPSVDDLFAMDSQLLLQSSDESEVKEEGISPGSSNSMSPFTSEFDLENDFLRGTSANMDMFPLEFNDYSSVNSSDSGKHSPSGSDSFSEHSPWVYPSESSSSIINEHHEYDGSSSSCSDGYSGEVQSAYYQTPTLQNSKISSEYSSQNSRQAKMIYIVPKQPNGSLSQPPIVKMVKPTSTPPLKESPVHPTVQPIFINKVTGVQLKAIPAMANAPCIQIAPAVSIVSQNNEIDEFKRKQEDRKMKNRAAAQASRLRKRCEADEMKSKITHLELDNERLRKENGELKLRLLKYEKAESTWPAPPARKRAAFAGACVMAIFMMVSLNPIDLEHSSDQSHVLRSRPINGKISHGKVLDIESSMVNPPTHNETVSCGFKKSWLNKTETIRLNTDLYNWVDRHEQMELHLKRGKRVLLRNGPKSWPAAANVERVNVTEEATPKRSVAEKKEHARQTAIRDRAWKHLDMISQSSDTLRDKRDRARKLIKLEKRLTEKSAPSKEQYEKLATAIQHRPDTLYVVTMKDYFLLPAITRNETSRPRIALILPALSFNGTIGSQVSMMRIDLDVVGTGLFQLPGEFVPLFFS